MAFLNICGFESGDFAEAPLSSGAGATVQSTTKRTGTYALQVNISGTPARAEFSGIGANGKSVNLGRTAATYYKFDLRFGTLPSSSNHVVAGVRSAASADVVTLLVSIDGTIQLFGTNLSASAATLTTGVWYRIELKVVSNGTSEIKVNGGAAQTCTANNVTQDHIYLGGLGAGDNYNAFYDDLAISDSAYIGAGQVNVAVPTGNSATNTAWSASAGNKWACIDELPPSATDYIESLTTAGDRRYSATHGTFASIGGGGAIGAVKVVSVMWEPSSTTTLGVVGIRSGSTNFELTAVDIGSTVEVAMCRLDTNDPNTSAAWTSGGFDAAEPLVRRSTSDTSNIRCKWLGLMAWSTGATAAQLVLGTVAGVATAAVSALSAKALLVPGTSAGVATATVIVGTKALLVLSSSAGIATATALVRSLTKLGLGSVAGIATAVVLVKSPTLLSISSSGIATAILDPLDAPQSGLVLGQVDGVATAALGLGSPALLAMLADGAATAAILLQSPTLLAMVADGLSSAALTVISPALLAMAAAGLAEATMVLTASEVAFLILSAAAGLSTAAITVISPALFIVHSDGVATVVAEVATIPTLNLGQVDGVATATLSALDIFLRKRHRLDGGSLIFSTRFNGGKPIIHTSIQGGSRIFK